MSKSLTSRKNIKKLKKNPIDEIDRKLTRLKRELVRDKISPDTS